MRLFGDTTWTIESTRPRGAYARVNTDPEGAPDTWAFEWIKVPKAEQGKGTGTKLLNEVLQAADKEGKKLTLVPNDILGEGQGLTRAQLVEWYGRHGFKAVDKEASIMTREPGASKPKEEIDLSRRGFLGRLGKGAVGAAVSPNILTPPVPGPPAAKIPNLQAAFKRLFSKKTRDLMGQDRGTYNDYTQATGLLRDAMAALRKGRTVLDTEFHEGAPIAEVIKDLGVYGKYVGDVGPIARALKRDPVTVLKEWDAFEVARATLKATRVAKTPSVSAPVTAKDIAGTSTADQLGAVVAGRKPAFMHDGPAADIAKLEAQAKAAKLPYKVEGGPTKDRSTILVGKDDAALERLNLSRFAKDTAGKSEQQVVEDVNREVGRALGYTEEEIEGFIPRLKNKPGEYFSQEELAGKERARALMEMKPPTPKPAVASPASAGAPLPPLKKDFKYNPYEDMTDVQQYEHVLRGDKPAVLTDFGRREARPLITRAKKDGLYVYDEGDDILIAKNKAIADEWDAWKKSYPGPGRPEEDYKGWITDPRYAKVLGYPKLERGPGGELIPRGAPRTDKGLISAASAKKNLNKEQVDAALERLESDREGEFLSPSKIGIRAISNPKLGRLSKGVETTVPTSSLVMREQGNLTADRVAEFIRNPRTPPSETVRWRPPYVVRLEDGTLFVANGNHRVAAAILRGEPDIKVTIAEIAKKPNKGLVGEALAKKGAGVKSLPGGWEYDVDDSGSYLLRLPGAGKDKLGQPKVEAYGEVESDRVTLRGVVAPGRGKEVAEALRGIARKEGKGRIDFTHRDDDIFGPPTKDAKRWMANMERLKQGKRNPDGTFELYLNPKGAGPSPEAGVFIHGKRYGVGDVVTEGPSKGAKVLAIDQGVPTLSKLPTKGLIGKKYGEK